MRAALTALYRWAGRAIIQHQAVRRLAVVWACILITWVATRVFTDLEKITPAVVDAMALITGLLSVLIGSYGVGRYLEGRRGGGKGEP